MRIPGFRESARRLRILVKAAGWLRKRSRPTCRARSSRSHCWSGFALGFPTRSGTRYSPSCETNSAATLSRSLSFMEVLCFDIGSGGIRGARFNEQLGISAHHEVSWDLHRDAQGHATLSVYDIECAFSEVALALTSGGAPAAVSIA